MADEKAGKGAKVVRLHLDQAGAAEISGLDADRRSGGGSEGEPPDSQERPIQFSDDALALMLSDRLEGKWLHLGASDVWLRWDGKRWAPEKTKKLWDVARRICRTAAGHCPTPHSAAQVSSKKTIYAIATLAGTDRRHAASLEEFDVNPMTLNTPEGIVDLATGRASPHDPAAKMTRITPVGPRLTAGRLTAGKPTAGSSGGLKDAMLSAAAPRWERYLHEATGGDKELQAYLKRIAGYCLTGSIEEHAVFFAFGPGGAGKSVFLNALSGIMGDYATTAPMDVFTVSRGERHPTELAMLAGRRLVIATETEEGRRWDEAKLKAITGGDRITARQMRQDFFSFLPTFKLFMAGNYRPTVRSVDAAMRRRLNIVPFQHVPPKPDKKLSDRLKREWPGILAWAVEGALDWQKIGLSPPDAVRAATGDYFEAEDVIGRWIEERCAVGVDQAALTRELFGDWRAWAEVAKEWIGKERQFADALKARGFKPRRFTGGQHGFSGIGLKEGGQQNLSLADSTSDEPWEH